MRRSGVRLSAGPASQRRRGRAWPCAIAAVLLLAFGAGQAAAATNLLANGGFESGLQGWQHFGDATPDALADHWVDFTPTEGVLMAALGDNDQPGLLRQTIAATAGRTYRLSFDLGHLPHGDFNLFRVLWGGDTLLEMGRVGVFPFKAFSFDVVAYDASPSVTFQYIDDGRWLLDDVRLTEAVPEPATWTMLILGFGLAGAAVRHRRLA